MYVYVFCFLNFLLEEVGIEWDSQPCHLQTPATTIDALQENIDMLEEENEQQLQELCQLRHRAQQNGAMQWDLTSFSESPRDLPGVDSV